ncbi:SWF/SNF helicase family protein [Methylobacterium sp. J-072]|uniref:DEAD/DEAH box helicase n=1 Tax=Methylobacterium sp. J-072 TaxID=2836651 RepID=UPI001FB97142|nr:C-terminal helicase domain-containing protein [Methylobacterium sp. J-072]MCJ2091140.1 SWF/SNF helicase family protein [Methylobacterium sp. J-072]
MAVRRLASTESADEPKLHADPHLALRRIKDVVARDLPEKVRRLHPRPMPDRQAEAYEDAHFKLAQGGAGAALKMLHHIRTVSVHPSLDTAEADAAFVEASARLSAVFEILGSVAEWGERALVFVEHRRMQHRFVELARARFGLPRVDLINGDTPISQRQAIVNRFQRHLDGEGQFDLLVLGPKAAGTGLTLTAATHVIHLSRWWNPAVEEQCNDRVHRLGQTRPVTIHVPMAIHPGYREGSFDCLLHGLMHRKRQLAASALWPMGDTQADVGELTRLLDGAAKHEGADSVRGAVTAMFARDGLEAPIWEQDGSIRVS